VWFNTTFTLLAARFDYEERGWKLAGAAIPVLYVAWSLWLLGLGIALIA